MVGAFVAARDDSTKLHSSPSDPGVARLYAAAQADDRAGGGRAEPGAENPGGRQCEDRRRAERRLRIERTTDAGSVGEWVGRRWGSQRFRHRATGARPSEEEAGSADGGTGRAADEDVSSDV